MRGGFRREKQMVRAFFNYCLVLDTKVNLQMIRSYWENEYQPMDFRSMKEVLVIMYFRVMAP